MTAEQRCRWKARWRIWIPAILAAGLLAINILAWNHAHAMLVFAHGGERTAKPESLGRLARLRVLLTGVNVPRPSSRETPADVGLPFERFSLVPAKGVMLAGWYCPRKDTAWLALLFHGYAKEKASQLPEARRFHDMGCSVLMLDFRGSGESSGNSTTLGYREAEDVAAAYRYARQRFPKSRILLFGQSMGAAAVLRALHVATDVKPDAIIAEAVFDSMLETVKNRFALMGVPSFPCAQALVFWGGRQAGFNAFRHNPVDYARSVDAPILFMQGSLDTRARVGQARRVFDAVPHARKTFVEFPGAAHESCSKRDPEQWTAAVSNLLAECSKDKAGEGER